MIYTRKTFLLISTPLGRDRLSIVIRNGLLVRGSIDLVVGSSESVVLTTWLIGSRLLNSFLSFNYIAMLTFIALCGFVLLAGIVIGYWLGHYYWLKEANDVIDALNVKLTCANWEIEGLKLARKVQTQKYDEVYSQLLKVNEVNAKLNKEKLWLDSCHHVMPRNPRIISEKEKADLLRKSFCKEMWNEVYQLWLRGASRKSLAKKFGVSYPHICQIIRNIDRRQDPLF
jgi:hypothetical protein